MPLNIVFFRPDKIGLKIKDIVCRGQHFAAKVPETLQNLGYSEPPKTCNSIPLLRGSGEASQMPRNYPHRGVNFERGKKALSCGGEAI